MLPAFGRSNEMLKAVLAQVMGICAIGALPWPYGDIANEAMKMTQRSLYRHRCPRVSVSLGDSVLKVLPLNSCAIHVNIFIGHAPPISWSADYTDVQHSYPFGERQHAVCHHYDPPLREH